MQLTAPTGQGPPYRHRGRRFGSRWPRPRSRGRPSSGSRPWGHETGSSSPPSSSTVDSGPGGGGPTSERVGAPFPPRVGSYVAGPRFIDFNLLPLGWAASTFRPWLPPLLAHTFPTSPHTTTIESPSPTLTSTYSHAPSPRPSSTSHCMYEVRGDGEGSFITL